MNYFLKCENCGFLTQITRENHNWCYNCTKRFPAYYKLWKKNNNNKSLLLYQEELCHPYSDEDVKTNVNPHNRKVGINNPSREIKVRRRYIDEGIPMDRGGFTEWGGGQVKRYYIPMLVLFIILIVLAIILEK